jgi:hypothetical protein
MAAFAIAAALLIATPAAAQPTAMPQALDYLSATQRADGGFSASSTSGDAALTPWVIMAISASGQNPADWTIGDQDPVGFLRGMNITSVAQSGAGSGNTPAFYAKLILAFKAAGRPDLIIAAGQPEVDLVQALLQYRVPGEGHFSASQVNAGVADVSTTAWAMLALAAAGGNQHALTEAAEWLRTVQADDGGFPFQTGGVNDVDDTAAVIQAWMGAGIARDDPAVQAALEFILSNQNDDGGFMSFVNDPRSTAESTAWAIQAIRAAGQDPASWKSPSGISPLDYLTGLQTQRGLFEHRKGQIANPLMSTTQALIALGGRQFPFDLTAAAAKPEYPPSFTSFSPADNATVTAGTIQVKCEFADNPGGTGIDTSAVQVLVNGEDKTPAATITNTSLSLTLTAESAGSHTLTFTIADHAGHRVSKEVRLNVTAPTTTSTASTTSTTAPTTTSTRRIASGTGSGGGGGTTTGTTRASFPRTTTGTASTRTQPLQSPSYTGATGEATPPSTFLGAGNRQPATPPGVLDAADGTGGPFEEDDGGGLFPLEGAAEAVQITGQTVALDDTDTGGGRGAAGLVGGGVLALLPLGVALSVLMHRRQTALLAQSIEGGPVTMVESNDLELVATGKLGVVAAKARGLLSSSGARAMALSTSVALTAQRFLSRFPYRGAQQEPPFSPAAAYRPAPYRDTERREHE